MPDPYWVALQKSATDTELIEAAIERIFNTHDFVLFVSTWNTVPKSQVDSHTIDEEIDDKIQDHDDDPDAHLDADQALQSHKASEIIDHVASSIIADKIKDFEVYVEKLSSNKLQLWPSFESKDAWTFEGSGHCELYLGALELDTGNGLNYSIAAQTTWPFLNINFGLYNPIFEAVLSFDASSNFLAYFGVGPNPDEFFGFKVSAGVLYACVISDGEEYTNVISGVDFTVLHTFRCVQVSGNRVEFYIDGLLVYTDSENFNLDTSIQYVFFLYIKTTNSLSHRMLVADLRFIQDSS